MSTSNELRSDDQLVLQDDPNFLPDFDLMPVDLDRLDLDMAMAEDSQRSTLSPHSSQLSGIGFGSQQDIGGLIIPPSASSFLGGPVSGFGGFSVRGDSGAGTRVDQHGFLDDDLGFAIDDDGNLRMSEAPTRQPRAPAARSERMGFEQVSSGVRHEHGEGLVVDDMVSDLHSLGSARADVMAARPGRQRRLHASSRRLCLRPRG